MAVKTIIMESLSQKKIFKVANAFHHAMQAKYLNVSFYV